MIKITKLTAFAITTGAFLSLAGNSMAGDDKCLVIDDKCPTICKEDPCWCEIFDKSTLYKNEENCLVQKVALAGRYHGQYLSQSLDFNDASMPANGFSQQRGRSYWEHRRFRLGVKVQFLNDFTFFNNWNLADNSAIGRDQFFNDIDEMYIKWKPSDFSIGCFEGIYVTAGKQKSKITREFATSSKEILTFERSHIVNEVIAHDGKPWGIAFGFEFCDIDHEFGAWLGGMYESSSQGAVGPDWPDFNHGNAAFSYRGSKEITDDTTVFLDYLYTNVNAANGRQGTADDSELSFYNHVLALGTHTEWDLGTCDRVAGLYTDLIWGRDREARTGENGLETVANSNDMPFGEDTFGLVLLPYYDLTERLQVVGKYAYASNTRLHRTQRHVPDTPNVTGADFRPNLSDVHTFYAGLNYRLCGDNLKLMAGYEYLSGDIYSAEGIGENNGSVTGDSWMLGVRTYW